MAAMYLVKAARHREGAPVESLDHFEAMRPQIPPLGAGTRLSFVGDAMWLPGDYTTFAADVAPLLDGDLRVGNLETPVDPDLPTDVGSLGLYAFNSPPALLDGLPLDLVQVNNNHSMDAGDAGLESTLAQLDVRGIAHTGADGHAILDVGGRRVAFLSYTWGLNQRGITPAHDLFVVPFGHLDAPVDLSRVARDIADARSAGARSIVLLLHWGYEYEYYPDPHFEQLARQMVTLGADLIVGEGPHVVQPAEICHVDDPSVAPGVGTCSVRTADGVPRTAAILYSLGDFQSIVATTACQVGIVATVSLDDHGVTGLGWMPVANVDAGGHHALEPLDALLDDPELAAESDRLDALIGAGWRR